MSWNQLVKFCIFSIFLFDCFYTILPKNIFILSNLKILNNTNEFEEINLGINILQKNEDNTIYFNETRYIQSTSCTIEGFRINIRFSFFYFCKQ